MKKAPLTSLFGLCFMTGLCAAISDGLYFPYANFAGVGLLLVAACIGRRVTC